MGIGRLEHHADAAPSDSGAVAALLAELRGGAWRCWDDVVRHYPSALVDGEVLEVDVTGGCRVRMIVRFEACCVLILSAWPKAGARTGGRKK